MLFETFRYLTCPYRTDPTTAPGSGNACILSGERVGNEHRTMATSSKRLHIQSSILSLLGIVISGHVLLRGLQA